MENLRKILSQNSSEVLVSYSDAECEQLTSPSIVSSVNVKHIADCELMIGIKDQEIKKVCSLSQ